MDLALCKIPNTIKAARSWLSRCCSGENTDILELFDPAEQALSVPEAGVATAEWQSLLYDSAVRDSWGLESHSKRAEDESEGDPSSYSSSRREYVPVFLLAARDVGWQNAVFWSWPRTPRACPAYMHTLYQGGTLFSHSFYIFRHLAWIQHLGIWQLLRPGTVAWIQNVYKAFSELAPNCIQHMLGEEIEPWFSDSLEDELSHEPTVQWRKELKRLQHVSVPRTWKTIRVNKHNHYQHQSKTEMIINIFKNGQLIHHKNK